jgi:hypothetical protein
VQENVTLSDPKNIAKAFNKYFVSITDELNIPSNTPSLSSDPPRNIFANFDLTPTNTEEVLSTIKSLKVTAATGCDGISSRLLKTFSNQLAPILCKFINSSFQNGHFPNCLKKAIVSPIYKSGNSSNPSNYRPISVLPVFSKVFEIITKTRIRTFLTHNKILHEEQYGFEQQSNTTAACLALTDFITKSMDKGKHTACVFIDLRKAFDCVDPEVLLDKLKELKFSNSQLSFFKSYLTNRQQSVKVLDQLSCWLYIFKGVPQGSILGPDLFKIYIDGLARLPLKGHIQLYADDAVIKYSVSNENLVREHILHDLKIIDEWLTRNKLLMNLDKTKIMLFDNKHFSNVSLIHNNVQIEIVDEYDYLGLIIDKSFKWNKHIDHIIKKISPYIFLLRRLRKFFNPHTLYVIYSSFIISKVTYLNCIWNRASETSLNKINILLKKAIKLIHNYPLLHPTNLLYNDKYVSFDTICKRELYITAFKIVNNKIKHNFIINRSMEIHTYNTRNKDNFYLTLFKTDQQKKNCLYNCLKMYNSLPADLKNIESLILFKKEINRYLQTEH